MRKLSMAELNRKSVQEFRQSAKHPIVVVLENIRSMHNVGSVFRTADAFLVSKIVLTGYTPVPPHRDIEKTALGATDSVAWSYEKDALTVIQQLKADGYRLLAVEQVEGSTPLNEFSVDIDRPLAIIFGNEVSGVSDEVLQECSGSIEIPQAGMKHSLNIAVAAGIVLWELVRSRIQTSTHL
jgi:tRNA G18 (ribose-2'-O)-methylase SpoU